MSDAEIEQKREEDERLDTAEDPNEEVRGHSTASKRASNHQTQPPCLAPDFHITTYQYIRTRTKTG
jgi:hypothetical protein